MARNVQTVAGWRWRPIVVLIAGVQLERVADLRERLIDRALEQAARVEFVSGEAADLLDEHDGIGAWTRY